MARCEDCLHFDLCEAFERHNGLTKVESTLCGFYKPTADVAPRAEVAREIFEEIESEIVAALQSNYRAKQERVEKQLPDDFVSYMCEGKIAALRGIEAFVEELKKKYTEGKNEKTYK